MRAFVVFGCLLASSQVRRTRKYATHLIRVSTTAEMRLSEDDFCAAQSCYADKFQDAPRETALCTRHTHAQSDIQIHRHKTKLHTYMCAHTHMRTHTTCMQAFLAPGLSSLPQSKRVHSAKCAPSLRTRLAQTSTGENLLPSRYSAVVC